MKPPAATDKLNDGQRAALDLGRDLLVSAGAGAGKTQVLALRILAALEYGRARVPEIVAFTFTEKAAAEMRQRVQGLLLARLEELRAAGPSPELENLRRARAEFAQSRITTVHGFCHRLLAEYAWETNLEPGAPVLEPRDQAACRDAAVRRVLLHTGAQDPLAGPLERLSANARMFALVATLRGGLAERATFGRALRNAATAWRDPEAELARRRVLWRQWQARALEPVLQAMARFDRAAIARAAGAGDKLAQAMQTALEIASRSDAGVRDFDPLLRSDGKPRSFGNAGNKNNWPKDTLEAARQAMTEAVEALGMARAMLGRFVFDEAHERRCGGVLADLDAVFAAVCAAYAEECAGALDFLELELRAIALLRDHAAVAREVGQNIRLILVDEYQDTNPAQAELFALLAAADATPGRFFAVGDSKQSIYGFRGSDVSVFNNAEHEIAARNRALAGTPQSLPWGLATSDEPRRRLGLIGLDTNYRSRQSLLDAGNELFARVFHRDVVRPFDARPQAMRPPEVQPFDGPAVHLHMIAAAGRAAPGAARTATEAEFVARRVLELTAGGVPAGDIAILVRRGTRNDDYRAAFANAGIPLLLVGDSGLLNTQEAQDCINLLRLCADPLDDMAALAVLRSPLGGLSDPELTRLALSGRGPLLERLRKWSGLADCPAGQRFLGVYDELQALVGREPPALLLAHAIGALGYALAIGCGNEADQRLANLNRLVEVTRELQTRWPVLGSLARELAARAADSDDEPQGLAEQSAGGVRLMTVHRSKGLEFSVVIVPDIGSRPGSDAGLVRDVPPDPARPLGLWLKAIADDTRGQFMPDFAAWQASLDAAERSGAEEKRVLYVAWTRAKHQLVLIGTMTREVQGESWGAQILRAIGVTEFGQTPTRLPRGMTLNWQQPAEAPLPVSRQEQIGVLRRALQEGRVGVPAPLDVSLVTPLEQPQFAARAHDPEAAEFGSLVHSGLEHCLRTGSPEAGLADATVREHVATALEALRTLPPAIEEKPEFSFVTTEGARRVDLLRVLAGDRFQIIDFKSDEIPRAGLAQVMDEKHGTQLRDYARALRSYLESRGRPCSGVDLYVCLSGARTLAPEQRLVEISP
ncbi:MAG: UvrD-helicase domain-containing protein [Planctomycetes bacterium]|nr:UvrD-helicase domain-containing protein [Planctomycetota bacterium]MCL4729623.1 UvrD-helicase domain-containing protein [Planctomycetota bacterium]